MDNLDAQQWAIREYGAVRLGNAKRQARLIRIGAELMQDAAASIPRALKKWSQTKAMYRFTSNKEVTHERIVEAHADATARRCGETKRVLVVQDTTHCSFSARKHELPGDNLGFVDSKDKGRGFLAHSALAIGDERRPLGLLAQRVWARPQEKRPRNETSAQRKRRARESDKWPLVSLQVHERLAGLGENKPHVVEVFDREGDAFEAIEALDRLGHSFIIRAAHDRLLETDAAELEYLSQAAAFAPLRGHVELSIPARPGRRARLARMELRSTTVVLEPPRNRDRAGLALEVSIVSVVEVDPPAGEERVCWLLLTREPCATAAEAAAVVSDYACRWLIEEFHMALKTGCSLEKRRFETFDRLANVLAIFNPIAVQMLTVRHLARSLPSTPAVDVITPTQMQALRILRPTLPEAPSVRDALRAIAQLGGFLARKSDGEPGWRTLWLGFRDLLVAERVLVAIVKSSG